MGEETGIIKNSLETGYTFNHQKGKEMKQFKEMLLGGIEKPIMARSLFARGFGGYNYYEDGFEDVCSALDVVIYEEKDGGYILFINSDIDYEINCEARNITCHEMINLIKVKAEWMGVWNDVAKALLQEQSCTRHQEIHDEIITHWLLLRKFNI